MGVLARGVDGKVLFAATRRVRACNWWPPKIDESRAPLLAIKLAKHHGYANIILESDSEILVSRLSKVVVFMSNFDHVLEDILFHSSSSNSIV